MNVTNAFGGEFLLGLPGRCGIHHSEGYEVIEALNEEVLRCKKEAHDSSHLFSNSFMIVEENSGVVLYSSFSYVLYGSIRTSEADEEILLPLYDYRERMRFDDRGYFERRAKREAELNFKTLFFSLGFCLMLSLAFLLGKAYFRIVKTRQVLSQLRASRATSSQYY